MTTLTMTRGDTASFSMTVTRSGSPVDLTGCSLWFTAKALPTDADDDATFRKTVGDGVTVTDAAAGAVSIRLASADTESLPGFKTTLRWDVQLREADGTLTTLDAGALVVEPDITRATS